MNNYILNDHKNNVFAISNYGDNNKILVKDIINLDVLLGLLYEFDCQEISITKEGFLFLKNYYGLNFIAEAIIDSIKKGVDFKYTNKEDIIKWLEI